MDLAEDLTTDCYLSDVSLLIATLTTTVARRLRFSEDIVESLERLKAM